MQKRGETALLGQAAGSSPLLSSQTRNRMRLPYPRDTGTLQLGLAIRKRFYACVPDGTISIRGDTLSGHTSAPDATLTRR
jgi:hypothetical protein